MTHVRTAGTSARRGRLAAQAAPPAFSRRPPGRWDVRCLCAGLRQCSHQNIIRAGNRWYYFKDRLN